MPNLAYLLGAVALAVACAVSLCNVCIVGGFVGALCDKGGGKCEANSTERQQVAFMMKVNVGAAIACGLGVLGLVFLMRGPSASAFSGGGGDRGRSRSLSRRDAFDLDSFNGGPP
jgi:hypothetical protein